MRASLGRFNTLVQQQADFEKRSPLLQPLVLVKSDEATFDGALRDFRPAMPLTATGFAWGAAGFVGSALVAYLLAGMLRWCWTIVRPAGKRVR